MKVRSTVTAVRQKGKEWPDTTVTVKFSLVIEDAKRGDAVTGTVDKAFAGAKALVTQTLDRS